jgi:hypothetical protein
MKVSEDGFKGKENGANDKRKACKPQSQVWGLHAKVAESRNSIIHQSPPKENVIRGLTDDQIVAVSHHR